MSSRVANAGRLKCGVLPAAGASPRKLLGALAEAWGFEICCIRSSDRFTADCVVLEDANDAAVTQAIRLQLPALRIPSGAEAGCANRDDVVRFVDDRALAGLFHGMQLRVRGLRTIPRAHRDDSQEVVASSGGEPLWSRCGMLHRLSFIPRDLESGEDLCDLCKGSDFFHALPFLYLLQEVRHRLGWHAPPPRACFMFDDPNLHWSGYGFLDYATTARSAEEHNYHVSCATVPLDGWYVHRGAAALFRRFPDRLSLLVHGNDHTAQELARPLTAIQRRGLISSALQRVQGLERKAGVAIARVMAAPHGACSDEMLRDMARGGFEAACISPWSLRDLNPRQPWVKHLGIATSEVIGGLPVIPRFRLSKDCLQQAVIAALLDQPIVAVGHHEDLADGLGLLNSLADSLNSRGEVHWLDMESIARTNFWTRQKGSTLEVRPYSRLFDIQIPSDVAELCIEPDGISDWSGCRVIIQNGSEEASCSSLVPGVSVPVGGGQKVRVRLDAIEADSSEALHVPKNRKVRAWPLVRRLLSEARDRSMPIVRSLRRRL